MRETADAVCKSEVLYSDKRFPRRLFSRVLFLQNSLRSQEQQKRGERVGIFRLHVQPIHSPSYGM